MPGRFDVTPQELSGILAGEPAFRTRQVWRSLHLGREPEEMTDLPVALRSGLARALEPGLRPQGSWVNAEGDTTKWLWSLADGAKVETVLMAYRSGRLTVCISTQAGCAMACSFCATGQAGFQRQLTVGEIVEQVVRARRATPGRISNVVFMGMGEPLANYPNTWGAVERLHGDLGISARHLTVSTVGIVPGIIRLAE
jgi:23S rRNA (adenine2503-C2)-methyltransferase